MVFIFCALNYISLYCMIINSENNAVFLFIGTLLFSHSYTSVKLCNMF